MRSDAVTIAFAVTVTVGFAITITVGFAFAFAFAVCFTVGFTDTNGDFPVFGDILCCLRGLHGN
jgi:1,4-dihydroxy-2-naphthoate octaprenyltransferase